MSETEMLTIFSYDVSESRRRRKVARILEAAATRVQYSVFEARLTRPRAEAVAQRTASLLGPGDSLRMYSIGADGYERSRVFGDGPPFEPEEGYWLI